MTTTEDFLQQLEQEAITTHKMLSIVPDDKLDWRPHSRSMTLRQLVNHIAELPGWITITLDSEGFDIADNSNDKPAADKSELLAFYEEELAKGIASLKKSKDEDLAVNWTMSARGNVISVRPRREVIRMSLNQTIHHRAQLGVFLRLLDVPIPGSYGPSADELAMK